jgi:hypothetical protein
MKRVLVVCGTGVGFTDISQLLNGKCNIRGAHSTGVARSELTLKPDILVLDDQVCKPGDTLEFVQPADACLTIVVTKDEQLKQTYGYFGAIVADGVDTVVGMLENVLSASPQLEAAG